MSVFQPVSMTVKCDARHKKCHSVLSECQKMSMLPYEADHTVCGLVANGLRVPGEALREVMRDQQLDRHRKSSLAQRPQVPRGVLEACSSTSTLERKCKELSFRSCTTSPCALHLRL